MGGFRVFIGFTGGDERRFIEDIAFSTVFYRRRHKYIALAASQERPTSIKADSYAPGTKSGLKKLLGKLRGRVRKQNKPIRELVFYSSSHGTSWGCSELPSGCWGYKGLAKKLFTLKPKRSVTIIDQCFSGQMATYALVRSGQLFIATSSMSLETEFHRTFNLRFFASASKIKAAGGDLDGKNGISYWERFQYAKRDWEVRQGFPVFLSRGYIDCGAKAACQNFKPPFGKQAVTVTTAQQLEREKTTANKGRVAVVLYSDGGSRAKRYERRMKKWAAASGGHQKYIIAKLDRKTRKALKNDGIKFPSIMLVSGLRRHAVRDMQKPLSEIGYLARLSAPLLANALWDTRAKIRARAVKHFKTNWPEAIASLSKALTRPASWKSANSNPRRLAARLLAKVGRRAVPAIVAAMKHKNVEVKRYAILAASKLKDKRLLASLVAASKDSDIGVSVRAIAALHAYKRPKALAAARARLIDALKKIWNSRSLATFAHEAMKLLAAQNDPRAVDLLKRIFEKSSVLENRIHAFSALTSFKRLQGLSFSTVKRILKKAIRDGWPSSLRESAAIAVHNYGKNGHIPNTAGGNKVIERACVLAKSRDTTVNLFKLLLKRRAFTNAGRIMSDSGGRDWSEILRERLAKAVLSQTVAKNIPSTKQGNKLIEAACREAWKSTTTVELFKQLLKRGDYKGARRIALKSQSADWPEGLRNNLVGIAIEHVRRNKIPKNNASVNRLIEATCISAKSYSMTRKAFSFLIGRGALVYAKRVVITSVSEDWPKDLREEMAVFILRKAKRGKIPDSPDGNKLIEKSCIAAKTRDTTEDIFKELLRRKAVRHAKRIVSTARRRDWSMKMRVRLAKAVISQIKVASVALLRASYKMIKRNRKLASVLKREIRRRRRARRS